MRVKSKRKTRCVPPHFKKSAHARKIGDRTYKVKVRGGVGKKASFRKVKVLCNGQWRFKRSGA